MSKYKITMRLLTEAIFGSGHSVPGSLDLEIVNDEFGFPFMKAKTFKGNLREAMKETVDLLGNEYNAVLESLLGKENDGIESWKNLKFSDCRLAKNIRNVLEYGIKEGQFSPYEVKETLTLTRSFTSIDDNGSYKHGSLRKMRVIRRGLIFEVDIDCERNLTDTELGVLAISLRSLRHIGTMRSRGKGEIDCNLLILEDNEYKDKTDFYIDMLMKEVKSNA